MKREAVVISTLAAMVTAAVATLPVLLKSASDGSSDAVPALWSDSRPYQERKARPVVRVPAGYDESRHRRPTVSSPACRASQLVPQLLLPEHGRHDVAFTYLLRVTNQGGECALGGHIDIVDVEAAGRSAAPQVGDLGDDKRQFLLGPSEVAQTTISWGRYCGDARTVQFILRLTADAPEWRSDYVDPPRCTPNSVDSRVLFESWVLDPRLLQRPGSKGPYEGSPMELQLHVPARSVPPGSEMSAVLSLHNPTRQVIKLDPCPTFIVQIGDGDSAAGTFYDERELSCRVGDQLEPGATLNFQQVFPIPSGLKGKQRVTLYLTQHQPEQAPSASEEFDAEA